MREEEDILTGAMGPGTNQYDSVNFQGVFIGPAAEGDVRL